MVTRHFPEENYCKFILIFPRKVSNDCSKLSITSFLKTYSLSTRLNFNHTIICLSPQTPGPVVILYAISKTSMLKKFWHLEVFFNLSPDICQCLFDTTCVLTTRLYRRSQVLNKLGRFALFGKFAI